jgi:hypothetical protein
MHLPVVARVDVGQRRGDAPFGHHRVGFAQQRLAHQTGFGPLGRSGNRGPQAGAAGADDEHVVLKGLVFIHSMKVFVCSTNGTRIL